MALLNRLPTTVMSKLTPPTAPKRRRHSANRLRNRSSRRPCPNACSGPLASLGRRVEGNRDELVHARIAKLVELVPDCGFVADQCGVLRAGESLSVKHCAIRRQVAVHREFLSGQ